MQRGRTPDGQARNPVENTNADLCFCRLIVEVPHLEPPSDHRLPSAHLGLDPAALSVAGGFLPGHPVVGCDFGDMAVAYLWVKCRLRASTAVLRGGK